VVSHRAALNVPRTRIERIAREEKPVTADTALRLGKFFKTGAAFWINIQTRFDLETSRRRARAADQEDRVLRGGVRVTQIARTEHLVTDSLTSGATAKAWFRAMR
jgi:addiction module HigA family antidote